VLRARPHCRCGVQGGAGRRRLSRACTRLHTRRTDYLFTFTALLSGFHEEVVRMKSHGAKSAIAPTMHFGEHRINERGAGRIYPG
jgi:hypothetical protein